MDIPSLFHSYGKRFFDEYSGIAHTWTVRDTYTSLEIPLQSEGGFEIYIQAESEELMVSCGGFHEHYPVEQSHDDFINHFYGFIYNLLTPVMRVVEFRAGISPYKWQLQLDADGTWETESTSALIFYNYFARKTTKVLSNSLLPLREAPIN